MSIEFIQDSISRYSSTSLQFIHDGVYVFADVTVFCKISPQGELAKTLQSTVTVRGYRSGDKVFDHVFDINEHDYAMFIASIYSGNADSACDLIVTIIKEIINEPVSI